MPTQCPEHFIDIKDIIDWNTLKYGLHNFGSSEAFQRDHCFSCPRPHYSNKNMVKLGCHVQ